MFYMYYIHTVGCNRVNSSTAQMPESVYRSKDCGLMVKQRNRQLY